MSVELFMTVHFHLFFYGGLHFDMYSTIKGT